MVLRFIFLIFMSGCLNTELWAMAQMIDRKAKEVDQKAVEEIASYMAKHWAVVADRYCPSEEELEKTYVNEARYQALRLLEKFCYVSRRNIEIRIVAQTLEEEEARLVETNFKKSHSIQQTIDYMQQVIKEEKASRNFNKAYELVWEVNKAELEARIKALDEVARAYKFDESWLRTSRKSLLEEYKKRAFEEAHCVQRFATAHSQALRLLAAKSSESKKFGISWGTKHK